MSATNSFETAILALLFNGTTYPNIAQNASSSPATVFYISLHTADPGEAGTQSTSEATYTSYARVGVNRNSGGFAVASGIAQNVSSVTFPTCTGGTNTITHFGIGLSPSGTGTLLFSGALLSSLAVSNTIAPIFQTGTLAVTCD